MQYGIVVWGSSMMSDRIFLLQKKALRIILKMDTRDSCRGLFKANGFLTFYGVYIYRSIIFLLEHDEYFKEQSNINRGVNNRYKLYYYPLHRCSRFERSAYYMCMKLYNNLPAYIRSLTCTSRIKREVYQYLLDIEPYSIQEYYM